MVVLLALACALLAGCGEDQRERYCDALRADQSTLSSVLSGDDPTALLTNLPLLRSLGSKAPDDLVDEWQTLTTAVEGLVRALREAGVEARQFSDGKGPSDLTVAERKEISDAADQLSQPDVVSAANGIDQQARDVCQINLGL